MNVQAISALVLQKKDLHCVLDTDDQQKYSLAGPRMMVASIIWATPATQPLSSLLNLVVLPIIYLFYFTVPIPKPCKVEKCIGSNCCLIQKPVSLLHKLAQHFLITVCWLVDYPSHYCQSLGIIHASRQAVSRGLKPRSYNLGDHLRVIHL